MHHQPPGSPRTPTTFPSTRICRSPCCRPCGAQGLRRSFKGTSWILPDDGRRARAFWRDPAVPVEAHSLALVTVALSKPRQAVGASPAPKQPAVCYGAWPTGCRSAPHERLTKKGSSATHSAAPSRLTATSTDEHTSALQQHK